MNLEKLAECVKIINSTDIATLWRKERQDLGLSLAQLARQLECSKSLLSYIESGDRSPQFDLIIKFANLKMEEKNE